MKKDKINQLLEMSLTEEPLTEADLKGLLSKLNPKRLASGMLSSLKTGDKTNRKKISSVLPKKGVVQTMVTKAIKGKETEFKKSQKFFKSYFKSINNPKVISNLSNAMACLSIGSGKGDAVIAKKIDSVMRKQKISEFVFPTINFGEETGGQKIVNIIFGIIQVVAELGLLSFAFAATGTLVGPLLAFTALWLAWGCLPENMRDYWIVIPI